ncbi:MAG: chemotaxis protein CheX [Thermoguttaceae bacterium]
MKVEYINPFVASTQNVFATMLECEISRADVALKSQPEPGYDVNAIIELSGRATGTVVLSLERSVAIKAASVMLREELSEVNDDVVDAVGELANILTGGAKAKLEELALHVSLPRVSLGRTPLECFPENSSPICISFDCPWGGVMLEVGLVEEMAEIPAG